MRPVSAGIDGIGVGLARGQRPGLGSHHATVGASDDWWTPSPVFEALGVQFDLDPCAPPEPLMPWLPATRRISVPADGLSLAWRGSVWLNPPYGQQVERWMRKLAAHGDGIALVPGRTDTAWYHAVIGAATVKCEIRGRITFIPGPGNPGASEGRTNGNSGAPSILLGFGPRMGDAVLGSRLGVMYRNPRPRMDDYQPTLWEFA